MKFNNQELKNLFDYILTNKTIVLSDDGLFSRDTLITLREIIKEKRTNDFELSKEQEIALINAFINSNMFFDENTPTFLRFNKQCIDLALKRNVSSVDYINIEELTEEQKTNILKSVINSTYILNRNSPIFLRTNYSVSLNSIRHNVSSADYVIIEDMNKNERNMLKQEMISGGYILTQSSPFLYKEDPDIAICSIMKDIKSAVYIGEYTINDPRVFNYLINHGKEYSLYQLRTKPVGTFTNYDNMKYALENIYNKDNLDFMDIFDSFSDEEIEGKAHIYIERCIKLITDALNAYPTIKSFKPMLEIFADDDWEEYRGENINDYANIFGKICIALKNDDDYSEAISKLNFLDKMNYILGDKYNDLCTAMFNYYCYTHGEKENINFNETRDQISKYAALYVAMSKEEFKKQKLKEDYYPKLINYFIPRKNHPLVRKKLLEHLYKDAFKDMYLNEKPEIKQFIDGIITEYSQIFDTDIIEKMVDSFVVDGISKLDKFIKAPSGFTIYKRYLEASKLINRLNSKYIKYTDQEVSKYHDIIYYDGEKYAYLGVTFSDEQVARYNEYFKKQRVFEKIKAEIMVRAKKLKINEEITKDDLTMISKDIPFNDEYFEFDKSIFIDENFILQNILDCFTIENNFIEPVSILDDEAYKMLRNFVINNSLLWFLMIEDDSSMLDGCLDRDAILETLDYMDDINKLSKLLKYNISQFEDIMTMYELSTCADDKSLAILGKDVVLDLMHYDDYTSSDAEAIINMAKDLVSKMTVRDKSTVPYISGSTDHYNYQMYDLVDNDILLAGIKTNACFRIDGNDNDFLHYCALDKNGFVIKITDKAGNFIGRAAGFRNGNCVFINQLRTIYDAGGYRKYLGSLQEEKNEIIKAFQKACVDIVETSYNNYQEEDKIDFVFVTQSYILKNMESNVSEHVTDKIGDYPMDNKSSDWLKFISSTENLRESKGYCGFTTDYSDYSLICMASSKRIIKPRDIKPKDVPAVYTRPRNKLIVVNNPDETVLAKINRIDGIYAYTHGTHFAPTIIPSNTTTIVGDNWYLITNDNEIIASCVLEDDKAAMREYKATIGTLREQQIVKKLIKQR